MGYHIVHVAKGQLIHEYIEDYEEIAFFDFITEDTIIYQGEAHWTPFRLGSTKPYKDMVDYWYRAGIQAQEFFRQQAIDKGYILEELNQDQKSFVAYTTNAKNIPIKRGDFLIRNFGNIEIDVKCRTFYGKDKFFDFKCEDVKKHLNMQEFTNTPILIAVYELRNKKALPDKVHFFPITLLKDNTDIKTHYRQKIGKCFKVPLNLTQEGFDLINSTFEALSGKKGKTYTVVEERINHPNAYKPWEAKDDELLHELSEAGKSIKEIAQSLGRKNSAIRSRLLKLKTP